MEHSAVILYLELNLNTKTIKFSCLWRVLCILTVIKDEIVCWSRHEKTKNAITSGDKCTFACRCLLQRNYCLLLLLQAKETVTIKSTLCKIYFHLKWDLWLKALTNPSWDLTQDTLLKDRQRQLVSIQPIRILFICCIYFTLIMKL